MPKIPYSKVHNIDHLMRMSFFLFRRPFPVLGKSYSVAGYARVVYIMHLISSAFFQHWEWGRARNYLFKKVYIMHLTVTPVLGFFSKIIKNQGSDEVGE